MGTASKVCLTLGVCLALIVVATFAEAGRRERFQYQPTQGNCANGQCQAPAFTAPATAPAVAAKPSPLVSKPAVTTAAPAKDTYTRDIHTGEVTRKTAAGEVIHLVVLDTDESVPARRKVTEYISRADLLRLSGINIVAGCKCGPGCKCNGEQKTAAVNAPADVAASWQMIAEHCEESAVTDTEVHVVHVPTPEDVVNAATENVESFVSTLRHREHDAGNDDAGSDDAAWDAIQVE